MATIFRIKRRSDAESSDALLIACKRSKLTDEDSIGVSTVVKFATTLEDPEVNVVQHLIKTLDKEPKFKLKKYGVNVLENARRKVKESSAENRYKVLYQQRSKNTSYMENNVTVIDVEDSISCTAKDTGDEDEDIEYAYDLYYPNEDDNTLGIGSNDIVTILSLKNDTVYLNEDTYSDENESDSNSESNWRNDYPDSDPDGSDEEGEKDDDDDNDDYDDDDHDNDDDDDYDDDYHKQMNYAMGKMNLSDGELSSDEESTYSLKKEDIEMYEYKYAKYKQKMLRSLEEYKSSDDNSDELDDSETAEAQYDDGDHL